MEKTAKEIVQAAYPGSYFENNPWPPFESYQPGEIGVICRGQQLLSYYGTEEEAWESALENIKQQTITKLASTND